ncbi:MAG: type I-C CRISPR-associated protein Cas8c/Csd1 [Fastidiosipila sp.]|nr:type I-C CRISPR-associated protein Cas8c/Csd1 [Fastidiosipila sp.]
MSWLSTLNNTYLNALNTQDAANPANPLLPISHTTQMAEIEVTIDLQGNFNTARVITDKSERQTLVPCTEDSASRSGSGAKLRPHPLHDKLQYVAGDYCKYGGVKGPESYQLYLEQLRQWVDSPYCQKELQVLLDYVEKGCLIANLITSGLLQKDSNGLLLDTWPDQSKKREEDTNALLIEERQAKSEKPEIFRVVAGNVSDAFIRFNFLSEDLVHINNPWESPNIIQSWIDYYESTQGDKGLDYVTGKHIALTSLHPKKIRHTGDSAKLLSANDKSGFTFRGRFETAEESSQVAYSVSQQAHNALKWLIQKQGARVGDRVFLVWGTGGEMIPNLTDSTQEIVDIFSLLENSNSDQAHENKMLPDSDNLYISKEALANEFKRALHGFQADLETDSDIAIIALDAATLGRMAVTFYREYFSGETNRYFDTLRFWHEKLSWYNLGYSSRTRKTIRYVGAPSLRDIAEVAFGVQRGQFLDLDSKVTAQTVQRLLPCVMEENGKIPGDIVQAAYTNALYPQKYSDFNWSKVRGVACSLIKADRNQRWKENWTMEVDKNTGDFTYNFGRWMAVLDEIEARALRSEGEQKSRTTAVERYFSKLAERPCATTEIIMKQLVPYRARLGSRGNRLYAIEQEVAAVIDPEELSKARNLDGRFLLGFDAQKHAIYQDYAKRREARDKEDLEDFVSDNEN